MLAEETLKIIIAVICIVFLAYLLISLYMKGQGDKELEMARTSLEHLVNEINAGATEVQIYNPEDWWISSWPSAISQQGQVFMPTSCSNFGWQNCLCISKEGFFNRVFSISSTSHLQQNIDERGVCFETNSKISLEPSTYIKVNSPMALEINYGSGVLIRAK